MCLLTSGGFADLGETLADASGCVLRAGNSASNGMNTHAWSFCINGNEVIPVQYRLTRVHRFLSHFLQQRNLARVRCHIEHPAWYCVLGELLLISAYWRARRPQPVPS